MVNKIIVSAYEQSCPLSETKGKRIRWWNKTLGSLRKEARRAFNLAPNRRTEEAWDEYRVVRRNFKGKH